MKVSIITVCYNSEKTICDTLDSVSNQSYKDIEHIIIDGKSLDSTLSILEKYISNKEFRYISECDDGIYDAMNKGIALASGDLIGILNSDDVYSSNDVIKNIVESLKRSKSDVLYGNIKFVEFTNINKVVRVWKSGKYYNNAFYWGWHPPHPSLYVTKDIYNKYGVYNNELKISADFEFMLRIIERYRVKSFYYDDEIVNMRYGGASTNSLGNIITGNINCLKAFRLNNLIINPLYPFFRLVPKLIQFLKLAKK